MLHLNVPASDDGFWTLFFRRLRWLLMGALAPETLLLSAGGQWASAKRSLADMTALGHSHWTMAHGFYADSGGFMLHSHDHHPFPVSAKQIHYLIKSNHIPIPSLTEKEIFDKSKADLFTKILACLQTAWFITTCLARTIQHLSLTPLELATASILLCTSTTYFFWLRKPLNVLTPTLLPTPHSLTHILLAAGKQAENPYRHTPLDFAEPAIYTFDQWPRLASLCGPHRKPLARLPNDRNPELFSLRQRIWYGFVVVCFSTSSFLAWHFPFPTQAERMVWRVACVVSEAALGVHGLVEAVAHWKMDAFLYVEGYKLRWPMSAFFFGPAGVYFAARLVLVGVAVGSLRSLPLDSFVEVEWSQFIPHI